MVRSCVFGFLAITLCFVACTWAHAAVDQHAAQEAVRQLKQLTGKVLQEAQNDDTNANYIKETVEERYQKAKKAESDAGIAAGDNEEAKAIANKAKSAFEELNSIYESAKAKAQKAIDFTKKLLSEARELDGRSKIEVSPNGGSGDDYSQVSARAAEVTRVTQELEKEIEKSKPLLNAARVEKSTVLKHAEDAQVAKHHVDAVVSAAKMKTLVSEADKDVASFHQKSGEINANLQEIDKHLKATTGELMRTINNFHTKADSDSRIVTGLSKEVQTAQQAIRQEETSAGETLTEIPDLTKESEVRQKAGSVDFFYDRAAVQLGKIKAALEKAKTHADSSNKQKQDTLNALASHNSKPGTVEAKEANKPSQTVEEATTKVTSEGTKEQKGTNPSQPLQEKTEKVTSEGTKEQKGTNPGQPLPDKTTKVTSEGTKEQKDTNPSQPSQEKTEKVTSEGTKEQKGTNPGQYVEKNTKGPGIKGKVSPYDTNNDGAITAAFSLLLALIVCAALN